MKKLLQIIKTLFCTKKREEKETFLSKPVTTRVVMPKDFEDVPYTEWYGEDDEDGTIKKQGEWIKKLSSAMVDVLKENRLTLSK